MTKLCSNGKDKKYDQIKIANVEPDLDISE